MLRTPPKRTASHSPDNARPYKRIATSSPEEGEVNDDDTPVAHALLRTPPRPVSPPRPPQKFETKVKYPFKKKNGVEPNAQLPPKPGPKEKESYGVIYERSEEDEWRIREKEQQRKQWSSHSELSRRAHNTKPNSVDHWEPSLDYASRDKERSRLPGSGWQYDQHTASRNKRGTATSDWDSYPARSRGRSSPSPSRSITPSSTPTRRGKHRLPSHRDRSPVCNFSPPQRDYGVDRIRDKQREKEDAWDRDRDFDRHYDGDYARRYHSTRDDRGNGDYDERYWRPGGSPSRQDYGNRDDYGARRRGMDSYRPASPGPSARTISTSAYPPHSPSPQRTLDGPRTPPPPSEPPPPPPPLISPKDETLPTSHPPISISLPMQRPGAPMDVHSPTPLLLPPAKESVLQEHERKESKGEVKELREVKKRVPVRRSRKEEYQIYGRPFEGCGMQSDYDVMTKLGEGTFG
jgi:serine/threonine-protein kinase BUR1